MIDKTAIAAKIRALLTKTTEWGCSEEEALMAASKAHELLEKYQISLTDTELRSETMIKNERPSKGKIDDTLRNSMAMRIAEFTDTKCWVTGKRVKSLVYAGLESDVLFARWLTDSLIDFCMRGAEIARSYGMDRRGFALGAGQRIAARLKEEVEARKNPVIASPGRALVLVTKAQMVDNYLKESKMKFTKNYNKTKGTRAVAAYNMGQKYGNDAKFNRPIAGSGSVAKIGHG
jgi:hypothetical protein